MTKTQVTALRKKLKAAVAAQKKKGMTLKASHLVYSPGKRCCCLLGAVVGADRTTAYPVEAAAILKITEEEAMEVEAGFMGWAGAGEQNRLWPFQSGAVEQNSVLYDLGAEFRP